MGTLLGDIGKMIGNPHTSTPVNPQEILQAATGGVAPPSAVNTMLGQAAPAVAPQQPSVGDVAAATDTPADIVVDSFKPKRLNFWKALGDQLLMHWGNKPAFQKELDQQNLQEAMQGFTHKPLRAIQRIASVDPTYAQKLYENYVDNARADAAQARLLGNDEVSRAAKKEKIAQGAVNVLRNVNENNYGLVRNIYNGIIKRNGLDAAELPEEYNPDMLQAIYDYGMTPTQADLANYRQSQLKNQERGLDIRAGTLAETTRSHRANEGLKQQDLNETIRSHGMNEGLRQQGIDLKRGGRIVKTKYGPGQVSADEKQMRVNVDGKWRYYDKTGNDTWKRSSVPDEDVKAGK